MSQNKTKKEYCESFEGFRGLDVTSPVGKGGLLSMKNFRLLPDGSAIKRSGFSFLCSLEGEVRGEKSYSDGGERVILAAVGRSLVRIRLSDGAVTSAEVFEGAEGSVKFFEYMGELYLIEGCRLFRYEGGCDLVECQPYVPLYGKGWSNNISNDSVNEPMNALTPRIAISYTINGPTVGTLYVNMAIASVEGVWGNGEIIPPNMYYVHEDGDRIVFDGYYFSGELKVMLTLAENEYRSPDLEGCDRIEVFDAFDDSRVFLFGGGDSSRVYVSAPIDRVEAAAQSRVYENSVPLYFPCDEPICFSGNNPINGICRIYDRALIFSEFRAWITTSLRTDEGRERRGLLLENATDTAGCSSSGGYSLIGGANPITLSHSGVFKWSIDDEFEEEMKLTRLSERVDSLLDKSFAENALVCRNRGENELWLADGSPDNGEVLVYNCDSGAWYSYDGIFAESLLEVGETVAFRYQNGYYVFSGEQGYDCFEWGERAIEAVIESADLAFCDAAKTKHVDRVRVTCQSEGEELLLELDDGDVIFSQVLSADDASDFHGEAQLFDIRMRTVRTRRARFRLCAAGRQRPRIYSVAFFAS